MDKLSLIEKEIVDVYYGEKEQNFNLDKWSDTDKAFQAKLGTALSSMDIPECQSDNLKVEVNVLDIIDKAYSIRTKKKNRLELVQFIVMSLALLVSLTFITISIGTYFFIYIQLAVFLLIPFSMIPLSKIVVNKGGA